MFSIVKSHNRVRFIQFGCLLHSAVLCLCRTIQCCATTSRVKLNMSVSLVGLNEYGVKRGVENKSFCRCLTHSQSKIATRVSQLHLREGIAPKRHDYVQAPTGFQAHTLADTESSRRSKKKAPMSLVDPFSKQRWNTSIQLHIRAGIAPKRRDSADGSTDTHTQTTSDTASICRNTCTHQSLGGHRVK